MPNGTRCSSSDWLIATKPTTSLQACWPSTVSTLLLLGTVILLPVSEPNLGQRWPSRLVAAYEARTREDVSAAFAKSWRHRFTRLAMVLQS
jgi:hypothetical protein